MVFLVGIIYLSKIIRYKCRIIHFRMLCQYVIHLISPQYMRLVLYYSFTYNSIKG